MSAEREELGRLILGRTAPNAADAVLAAGYRKSRDKPVPRAVHPGRREQLAKIIDDRWHGYGYNPFGAADAIIADGWIKPADEAHLVIPDEATIQRVGQAICAASFRHMAPDYAWAIQFEDGQNHFKQLASAALAASRLEG